jgi:hypothetical protein
MQGYKFINSEIFRPTVKMKVLLHGLMDRAGHIFFKISGPLGCAVRFRLKRNDAKIKQIFFRFEATKAVFSLVSFRSETLEITSETKASEAKKKPRET